MSVKPQYPQVKRKRANEIDMLEQYGEFDRYFRVYLFGNKKDTAIYMGSKDIPLENALAMVQKRSQNATLEEITRNEIPKGASFTDMDAFIRGGTSRKS